MNTRYSIRLALVMLFAPAMAWAQSTESFTSTASTAQPSGGSSTSALLECNTLAGRVTDAFNHPLIGATVMLRGSNDAFSTNGDGNYLLDSKNAIPRNSVLQISAAGYSTVELPLQNCQSLDVSLQLLPGTKMKHDGRIKKTATAGKIK